MNAAPHHAKYGASYTSPTQQNPVMSDSQRFCSAQFPTQESAASQTNNAAPSPPPGSSPESEFTQKETMEPLFSNPEEKGQSGKASSSKFYSASATKTEDQPINSDVVLDKPLTACLSQQGHPMEPRNIIHHLSLSDDLQLDRSEKAWKPSLKNSSLKEENKEEGNPPDVLRNLRCILNKLTPQKFQDLMKQVTELRIDTEETLKGAVALVFEKAISEPHFSATYAYVCLCLMELEVPTLDNQGVVNFHKLLLIHCQDEFEKGLKDYDDNEILEKLKELEATKDEEKPERLKVEIEEARHEARCRSLGNIKFIGELFKKRMLSVTNVHECVVKLLKNHEDEKSLECLCQLLWATGKILDIKRAKPQMDQYFDHIYQIFKDRTTSDRIHYMLQDVLELRRNKWVIHRIDQGPKRYHQVHKETQMEMHRTQEPQQFMSRTENGRGRMGGNMRGRGLHTRGVGRSTRPYGEGWRRAPTYENRPINNTRFSRNPRPGAQDFKNLASAGDKPWRSCWTQDCNEPPEVKSPASSSPPAVAAGQAGTDKTEIMQLDRPRAKPRPTQPNHQHKEEQERPTNPEKKKQSDEEVLFISQSHVYRPKNQPIKVDETSLQSADSVVAGPQNPPPTLDLMHEGQENESRQIVRTHNDDLQLTKAVQAWKPSMKKNYLKDEKDGDGNTQVVLSDLQDILNKLTPQKFYMLKKQVTELRIDTEETLKGAVALVFEKAISEPHLSATYAYVCLYLMELEVPTLDNQGVVNFHKLLLNHCQDEFEKGLDYDDDDDILEKLKELEASKDEEKPECLKVEIEEARHEARCRSLGNIKFIGELFKKRMLSVTNVHECVVKLLKNHEDEKSLECLCQLLWATGKILDIKRAKPQMDQYFDHIYQIFKDRTTSDRIHYMLQDVLELRRNKWAIHRIDQGPKRYHQVHKETQMEMHRTQEPQQFMSRTENGRGRMGGNMRGRGLHTRGVGRITRPYGEGWRRAPTYENRPINNTRFSRNPRPGAQDFKNLASAGDKPWRSCWTQDCNEPPEVKSPASASPPAVAAGQAGTQGDYKMMTFAEHECNGEPKMSSNRFSALQQPDSLPSSTDSDENVSARSFFEASTSPVHHFTSLTYDRDKRGQDSGPSKDLSDT